MFNLWKKRSFRVGICRWFLFTDQLRYTLFWLRFVMRSAGVIPSILIWSLFKSGYWKYIMVMVNYFFVGSTVLPSDWVGTTIRFVRIFYKPIKISWSKRFIKLVTINVNNRKNKFTSTLFIILLLDSKTMCLCCAPIMHTLLVLEKEIHCSWSE